MFFVYHRHILLVLLQPVKTHIKVSYLINNQRYECYGARAKNICLSKE